MSFRSFVRRHLLNRSLPHGLVSPRYLLPRQAPEVRIHRSLWLKGFPRAPLPLFLVMEAFLYLRWTLFSSWRGTFRAVRRLGPTVRDRDGMGMISQFLRVIRVALACCIPPSETYAFRLYRKGQDKRIWNYVFTHELPAFHRWRDLRNGNRGESGRILGDKQATAEILGQDGIPMVPTLEVIPPGGDFSASVQMTGYPGLFVKPRHGSAGRGCFVVKRDGGESRLLRV